MKPEISRRLAATAFSLLLLIVAPLGAAHDQLDSATVDRLRHSLNYLAGMEAFSLAAHSSLEVVLLSGQKIQFDNSSRLTVQRPNKLHAERLGDLVAQEFLYDGESLTLHQVDAGLYASVPAPGTLEEMLDFARDYLDIVAPAGDLIYSDAFELLMEGVHTAFTVGEADVAGVPCDHLAFSAPGTDFQIWIQQGDRPLPRKLIITSRDVVNAPQFSVLIDAWDQTPDLDEDLFHFEPPEDAMVIDFMFLSANED
jgi:hypothetical protein